MKNNSSGFTLIELLVVLVMIGLVAAALIVNFRQGEQQKRMNLARDTIISAVRYAQNQALSGSQIPRGAVHVRGNAAACADYSLVSSWVEFSTNNTVNVMAENRCGGILRLIPYTLPQQTQFLPANAFSVTAGGATADHNAAAVRFLPPFARMSVSTDANPLPASFTEFSNLVLNFEYTNGGRDMDVTVDGISGKIE